ncbi:MAG: Stp1/IreP family PP2C-type Ser/Thr phosphatase [Desulfobacterales bacterium]|jgi:PPM family protein phosphatase|nr:Stp1/IreP family PP2C-type Ser/Thr phosphatase [Desulfobacteraceae bacterium]MBT4364178.1 Stp1/IreP family PP2C-type Ser/Thr phosphatase [Desulfobacteraceae bacterium]MBT7085674.1 Stp1/IreP family PP2C-type Ser/Thr phosphatase [Desulfobacterales bacterium]MBT7698072.1 Stp1/IreP family PP2C-type Ser/Thr phosphatase [Desulfobacterales bacterium]
MDCTIASASDKGLRKEENQDYLSYYDGPTHKNGLLLVLADGIGGRSGGGTASKIAVETLMEYFYSKKNINIPVVIKKGFKEANRVVVEKGDQDISLNGMGCTMNAVVLRDDKMYHNNVGDSRGYIISGDEISQFSTDHSFVSDLVKAGAITEEDALTHPERHVLTKAIGIDPKLPIETNKEYLQIENSQYILLCCDGLYGVVPDEEILDTVNTLKSPDDICKKLIEKANENGGPDNISLIVVRINNIGLVSNLKNKFKALMR